MASDDTEDEEIPVRREIQFLRDRVAELEDRVVELESSPGSASSSSSPGDHRDHAVIKLLLEGEVYTNKQLTRLYKEHTDIRNPKTARERAKTLVESRPFEFVRHGCFRFKGVSDGVE